MMFCKLFESVFKGYVKVLVGCKLVWLDNFYVYNLIYGFILVVVYLVLDGIVFG